MKMKILLMTLFSLLILNSLANESIVTSNGQPEDTKFEENLKKYTREEIERIAFVAENYYAQQRKMNRIGGLHDYIFRLSTDEIIKIIVNYANMYPVLKEAGKLEELAGISTKGRIESYSTFLKGYDVDKLKKMALAAETFSRKKQGKENLLGGLHDYIDNLDKENIINIIIKFVESYPQLAKNNLLELLSSKNMLSYDEIVEKLTKRDETVVRQWALSCDDYDHQRQPRLGGLHDYIFNLNKFDVILALATCVSKNPELAIEGEIEKITESYKSENPGLLGGITDYIRDFNIEELKNMALAAEKYDRDQRGQGFLIGGLHDYINSLPKESVLKIVLSFINSNSGLRSPGVLEELAQIKKGGLIGSVRAYDIETLRKVALGLEKYDREQQKIQRRGGLHDYIYKLSAYEIVEYIRDVSDKYPEIRNEQKLKDLAKDIIA